MIVGILLIKCIEFGSLAFDGFISLDLDGLLVGDFVPFLLFTLRVILELGLYRMSKLSLLVTSNYGSFSVISYSSSFSLDFIFVVLSC